MSHAVAALESAPPHFDSAAARDLAAELFGRRGDFRESSGERDQTFIIEDGQERSVLKISNAAESESTLEFEAGLLRHLEAVDPGLLVPRLVAPAERPSPGGFARARNDGSEHFVRMYEYVEGRPGVGGEDLDDESVRQLGSAVAALGLAMRGYFHPGAGRELIWDLRRVADLAPLIERLPEARRQLVAETLAQFKADADRRWLELPAQVVHGDLTLENILFDNRGLVCGVIDFGDALHGPRLLDLASALASLLRQKSAAEALRYVRTFLDGYCRRSPLEPGERELLGAALRARLASIVAIGDWYVDRFPRKASYLESCVSDSMLLLEELVGLGPEELDRSFGVPRTSAPTSELVEKRRSLLGSALSDLFYDEPVHVVRAEGAWLIDADGRRLLDGYNNVAVVGHCNPRVTEAVVDQTRRVNTHTRYLYEPLFELGERLTDGLRHSSGLDTVMILNSGSEANDLTWRLATTFTGERGGLVSVDAYHGVTTAVSDLSPQQWPPGHRPEHIETFAVDPGKDEAPLSIAAGVEAAIGRLEQRGIRPAALLIEGSFTSDGVVIPDPADVNQAVDLARAAGAMIVADEVQAGHGRSGSHLWSFERYGYVPDFITMGKPMGNGYPVAAMVTRADIVSRFGEGTYYFSTFGGNPVAARAALAVLEVIDDDRLVEQVGEVGSTLTRLLVELRDRHPLIRGVRAYGTLIGVELGATETASSAEVAVSTVNGLRRRGVLVGRTGPRFDVLKIRPPLVFTNEHAAMLAEALDATLSELGAQSTVTTS